MKEGLEEILQRACDLMARRGYHGASMRDIAKATGYSLSSLYNYFENKEDLLFLTNYHGFSSVLETLQMMLKETKTPEEGLYALVYNHVLYFVNHKSEMRVMMFGTQELSAVRGKEIKEIKERYNKLGQKLVSEAYEAKMGERLNKKELERKTYLLFGMLNWIFGWYSTKQHGTAEELANDIFSNFFNGLLSKRSSRLNRERVEKIFQDNKPDRLWQAQR